jgi:hypothetical protein
MAFSPSEASGHRVANDNHSCSFGKRKVKGAHGARPAAKARCERPDTRRAALPIQAVTNAMARRAETGATSALSKHLIV